MPLKPLPLLQTTERACGLKKRLLLAQLEAANIRDNQDYNHNDTSVTSYADSVSSSTLSTRSSATHELSRFAHSHAHASTHHRGGGGGRVGGMGGIGVISGKVQVGGVATRYGGKEKGRNGGMHRVGRLRA